MLKELRTLAAVARLGSVTAAAREIGLTQAAASAQIQRLEESLQLQLFDRVGRHVRLNQSGIEIVSRAEHILHLCAELQDVKKSGALRGNLRLGAIQSMQRQYLPRVIQGLVSSSPDIKTHLELGGSLPLLTAVDQGTLDAAMVVKPFFSIPPELEWIPLLREPFKVICPIADATDDWRHVLRSRPFIRYDSASFGGRVVDRFLQEHHLQPDCHIECQDVDAILEIVACGIGAALIPVKDLSRHRDQLCEIDLGQDRFFREVGMVIPSAPRKRELVQELVRITREHVRSSPHAHPLLDSH
ncbi:LysR family transcriptional regulator [Bordetella sp. N]|uniref:LysR family transcriptional regulator n=1 Tax=Bordetella sp. N TaxID=1746199 RepID=UPI00070925DB|nr:LysR family transcriptional regulator [Bordetella sp. N]ALM83541.1 LysR family transcriptional regulator [Bordetella sp. N]